MVRAPWVRLRHPRLVITHENRPPVRIRGGISRAAMKAVPVEATKLTRHLKMEPQTDPTLLTLH